MFGEYETFSLEQQKNLDQFNFRTRAINCRQIVKFKFLKVANLSTTQNLKIMKI